MAGALRVQVSRIHRGNEPLPLPRYMSEHAAGLDLAADLDDVLELAPGARALVPTGIAVALPPDTEIQVRPRSGLALKYGVTVLNTPGTIDADYRGEIQLIAINLGSEPIVIEPGQRVAQMVVQRVVRAEWHEVSELPSSERQAGGFGHTDK